MHDEAVLLRLSFVEGGRIRTVSVRASRGTTWAALCPALGITAGSDLVAEYAGGTVPLRPDLTLGLPPLLNGATIRPSTRDGGQVLHAPVCALVTSGPDVGASYPLGPGGRLTVGRASWCDAAVRDPGLSRHHATLSTTRQGIVVEDAASTNGTLLGEEPLSQPCVWPPGVPLRVGATTLELSPSLATISRGRPDGEGRLVITPRSRRPPPIEPVSLALPALATPSPPVAPAVLGWLLPVLVSVLLAVVLAMPALMLFGLMAPAMSLGSYHGERRRYRRECAHARQTYQRDTVAVRRAIQEAVARELRSRCARVPDVATLITSAKATDEGLWTRGTQSLICRLGRGQVLTDVSVDEVPTVCDHMPLEADLRGGLALVGSVDSVRALARSMLIQLAVLHAPSTLRLEVPEAGAPWEWLTWLPHTAATHPGTADSTAIVTLHDLTGSHSVRVTDTHPVALPDDRLAHGARDTPVRIPIVLCRDLAQVPDVGTVVTLRGPRLQVRSGADVRTGTADLLSLPRAVQVSRALAALVDGSGGDGGTAIPDRVDFASIAKTQITAPALVKQWHAARRSTRFALGRDAHGTICLDLADDGPHALVAGTTGSGKSELLRTMITSLVLVNRPDELVMVLVDYKGGSAFTEAAGLPHVVGLITDLDPHLADRALTSLTAELKRRERLLAGAGVPDLPAYQCLPGMEPLPRLVLVIDEFRALAEELPGFLDGLVRIAALGRSLGVHLVLATQRPGGVVSADVRANVNLRIALRVRDASDSHDVIDSSAAAQLPEGVPGRALIRTGSSQPREIQVASVSTTPTDRDTDTAGVSVTAVHDLWSLDRHPLKDTPSSQHDVHGGREADANPGTALGSEVSILLRTAAATTEAAALIGAVPPRSPWLPALPESLTLLELSDCGSAGTGSPAEGESSDATYSIPLMLTDLPAHQAQPPHPWRPLQDGHLGVVGAPRTGRSTVARTVLAGLLSRDPDDVHIYAFDMGGSLGPIDGAPHVGALVGPSDVARGCRVVDYLADLVVTRQRDLSACGRTSLAEQHASGAAPWPLVVVVIDGWSRFTEVFGEAARGRALEQVIHLLREGLGVGVVGLLTGDRTLLSGRVAPLITHTWSLRLTDPSDLLMAGLTRAQVPESMPPGRVVRLRDGVVGQVATVGTATDGATQISALTALLQQAAGVLPTNAPCSFQALPRTVQLAGLLGCATSSSGLVVGVGGDACDAVSVPVGADHAKVIGVIGPPGSGRSTALQTIGAAARSQGWAVVEVTDTHLGDLAGFSAALTAATDHNSGALVLVDGLARIADTEVEDTLDAWLDGPVSTTSVGAGPPARLLVVAGEPGSFGGYRGLASRVARERTGILLQPTDPSDGTAVGVTLPYFEPPLPGRGVLVIRGQCLAIQVALPMGPPNCLTLAPPAR